MDRTAFLITVVDFIERAILPKVSSEGMRWSIGAALPFLPSLLNMKLNEYAEILSVLGVMDSDGNINLDAVKESLDKAFKAQATLKVNIGSLLPKNVPELLREKLSGLNVTFTQQDAKDFLLMLRER